MKSNNLINYAEQISNRSWYLILFIFAVSLFTFLSSCDQTFQPIQDNYIAPFSMFGYLDASVDTQRVRITPLRAQAASFSNKPDMKIMIKNLRNNETTVMSSSLTPFYLPTGYQALNSTAYLDIKFGHTYQLTAERPDGVKSTVEVTIPEDFPTPEVKYIDNTGCLVTLKTSGVQNLADVQYRMRIRVRRPGLDIVTNIYVPYRHLTFQESAGFYSTTINVQRARILAFERFGGLPENTTVDILERYFFVATGGPEWSEIEEDATFDEILFNLPNFVSNVENGVGYMFGIVSKSIPDTGCPNDLMFESSFN